MVIIAPVPIRKLLEFRRVTATVRLMTACPLDTPDRASSRIEIFSRASPTFAALMTALVRVGSLGLRHHTACDMIDAMDRARLGARTGREFSL